MYNQNKTTENKMNQTQPALPSTLPQVFYDFDATMKELLNKTKTEIQKRVETFVSIEKLYVEKIYDAGFIRPISKMIFDYLTPTESMYKATLMANNYIVKNEDGLFRYIEYEGSIIDTTSHERGTFKKVNDTLYYKNPNGKGKYYNMDKPMGKKMFLRQYKDLLGDPENEGFYGSSEYHFDCLTYELFRY
jgi:hypothetical protein